MGKQERRKEGKKYTRHSAPPLSMSTYYIREKEEEGGKETSIFRCLFTFFFLPQHTAAREEIGGLESG